MPNPFGKSRPIESPYAIYKAGDFTWHVIKTYKMPKSELKDPFARWMVAAKSDVTSYGRLVAAEPAWLEAYRPGFDASLPTPAQWLELEGSSS